VESAIISGIERPDFPEPTEAALQPLPSAQRTGLPATCTRSDRDPAAGNDFAPPGGCSVSKLGSGLPRGVTWRVEPLGSAHATLCRPSGRAPLGERGPRPAAPRARRMTGIRGSGRSSSYTRAVTAKEPARSPVSGTPPAAPALGTPDHRASGSGFAGGLAASRRERADTGGAKCSRGS
jgi:hypothetical protein